MNSHYNTLSDANNTAIFGSSMGGFISHYAIHEYPHIFSKAGIFSPSYWYSEEVTKHTQQHPLPASHRLYINVGLKEGKGDRMAFCQGPLKSAY